MTADTQETLRLFLENMVGEGMLVQRIGMDATPKQIVDASFEQILTIVSEIQAPAPHFVKAIHPLPETDDLYRQTV